MSVRPAWILGAAAAFLAASPIPLPPAARAAALAPTLLWTPGAAVAPWLAPRGGAGRRALLALVLAPFLTGGAAAALLAFGRGVPEAARLVCAGVGVAATIVALVPARPRPAAPEVPALWWAAGAWAGLVAVLLIANHALVERIDGWFHAAVTLQLLQRGLPLEDPFFAGLPLLYFWGYHAWCALWLGAAPGLSVWVPLVALNVTAAFATMLAVGLIARRLGADGRGVVAACGLAAFGYAPFAWVIALVRSMVGETRGEFAALLGGGIDAVYSAESAGLLHSSMVFFGDKFLIATSFALGLGLFGAIVLALLDLIDAPGRRAAVALGLLLAAALFLHTVIGTACAAMIAGWWLWAAWRSRRPEERKLRAAFLPLAAALAGALVLLAPYLLGIVGGGRDQARLGVSAAGWLTWLGAGALYVPPAMTWLWIRRRSSPPREVLALAVVLTMGGLLIALPHGNQSKFFNLLFLLLAAPAALAWREGGRRLPPAGRGVLAAVLALAIVPGSLLALRGFATQSAGRAPAWQRPVSAAERLAWSRARELTRADAVFVDGDGELQAPVRAGRSALWVAGGWETTWGHPRESIALRRRAALELVAGRRLSPEVARFVAGLDRDVVLVRRAAGAAGDAWRVPPPGFRPLLVTDGIAFHLREAAR